MASPYSPAIRYSSAFRSAVLTATGLGAVVCVGLGATGLSPASASAGVTPAERQIRVERSLDLQVSESSGSDWRGTLRVSRIAQIERDRDRQRHVWRSGPLHLHLQRVDCTVAGCLTTVITAPEQPPVVLPSRVTPGLTGAKASARMVPVIVERLEGDRVISTRLSVLRLQVSANAVDGVSAESATVTDPAVQRRTETRWAPATGIIRLTMMGQSAADGGTAGAATIEIEAASGAISVRRTTITPID